ncbi:MAG: hypothetical protein ACFFDU_05455 [Candidatus Thorarchaeota archaeon]
MSPTVISYFPELESPSITRTGNVASPIMIVRIPLLGPSTSTSKVALLTVSVYFWVSGFASLVTV